MQRRNPHQRIALRTGPIGRYQLVRLIAGFMIATGFLATW